MEPNTEPRRFEHIFKIRSYLKKGLKTRNHYKNNITWIQHDVSGDDDTDDDDDNNNNDHKNDSYTAAGAAPGASVILKHIYLIYLVQIFIMFLLLTYYIDLVYIKMTK